MSNATPLRTLRDDGAVASRFPRLPIRTSLAAGAVWAAVVAVALAALADVAVLAAALGWVGVVAGLATAGARHEGSLAWIAPPSLRALEYTVTIAVVATQVGTAAMPAVFAYLSAVVFHHYEVVYRSNHLGRGPGPGLVRALGGWEGRLAVLLVLVPLFGSMPVWVLAAWCAGLSVLESVWTWMRAAGAQEG